MVGYTARRSDEAFIRRYFAADGPSSDHRCLNSFSDRPPDLQCYRIKFCPRNSSPRKSYVFDFSDPVGTETLDRSPDVNANTQNRPLDRPTISCQSNSSKEGLKLIMLRRIILLDRIIV